MDTTLSSLHAGQLLDGRYRVGSWIARGGMATVYLGTDTKLDRTVALKVAHAELADDPEFVRRFTGEARSVARLVPCLESGRPHLALRQFGSISS